MTTTGWFDSHCHIYDVESPERAAQAVADAAAAEVTTLVLVGCDRASSLAALAVAAAHDEVHATVGLHPHEARFGVESIADLVPGGADGTTPIAVGECGFDFHYDHSPREAQRRAFAEQIGLANRHRLPLVIHTREAWDETFDVLDAEGVPDRVIFHCFTGGAAEAEQCLDRGAFLSFSGIVTFPSADDVRQAAQRCPLDRLLIETDSPYLAPVPHRGRPNRPALVPVVGAAVAELHGVAPDVVRQSSRAAARAAFRLATAG